MATDEHCDHLAALRGLATHVKSQFRTGEIRFRQFKTLTAYSSVILLILGHRKLQLHVNQDLDAIMWLAVSGLNKTIIPLRGPNSIDRVVEAVRREYEFARSEQSVPRDRGKYTR